MTKEELEKGIEMILETTYGRETLEELDIYKCAPFSERKYIRIAAKEIATDDLLRYVNEHMGPVYNLEIDGAMPWIEEMENTTGKEIVPKAAYINAVYLGSNPAINEGSGKVSYSVSDVTYLNAEGAPFILRRYSYEYNGQKIVLHEDYFHQKELYSLNGILTLIPAKYRYIFDF